MKKIGIVGSRRRNSKKDLELVIKAFLSVYEKGDIIVSGGCQKGADAMAERIAQMYDCHIIIHYPDKSKLPKKASRFDYTKINYARNTLIAQDSDVLIACVSEDRKGETEDTVKKYLKLEKKQLVLC